MRSLKRIFPLEIGESLTGAATMATASISTLMHLVPGAALAILAECDVYMDATSHRLMVYDGTI